MGKSLLKSSAPNGQPALHPSAAAGKQYQEIQQTEESLRRLPSLILEAQEAERRRVARELHDGVIQLLSSVHFRLQAMEEKMTGADPANWREVLKSKALVEKVIQEVHRISHNLRPSELDDLGLAPAVRSLCHAFSQRTGIATDVACGLGPTKFGSDLELNLYRIIQEALTNIEKHAKARHVLVRLQGHDTALEIAIRDDGCGFDPVLQAASKPPKPGIGLMHMKERAALLGGTCALKSTPGRGTEIFVKVPIPPDTASP